MPRQKCREGALIFALIVNNNYGVSSLYIIGLTGGIGTGKSTVAAMLQELGALVIDADQVARKVVEPGSVGLQEIVNHFGPEVLLADGSLNRKALGAEIFKDAAKRELLNSITHPMIKAEIADELDEIRKNTPEAVVVIEAPLLIEAGMVSMVDEVWLVTVSTQAQIERVMARDQIDYNAALMRVNSQMSARERMAYSQVVISTDPGLEEVRQQVASEWQRVKNLLEGSCV